MVFLSRFGHPILLLFSYSCWPSNFELVLLSHFWLSHFAFFLHRSRIPLYPNDPFTVYIIDINNNSSRRPHDPSISKSDGSRPPNSQDWRKWFWLFLSFGLTFLLRFGISNKRILINWLIDWLIDWSHIYATVSLSWNYD